MTLFRKCVYCKDDKEKEEVSTYKSAGGNNNQVKTFAAIDVGSYALELKIFEISTRNGIKEIDNVRYQLDLGTDSYATGKLGCDKLEELCRILKDFGRIMKQYKVDAYRAYGTSAIREIKNKMIVLDQIEQRTGIHIDTISNSEQRFLDYKSIACKETSLEEIMEKDTAVIDIGGGSIQLSLFENGTLVTTQNMKLGVLRLQESLNHLNARTSQYENLIDEMVSSQISVFKKLFLKDKSIKNLIVVDDYLSAIVDRKIAKIEGRVFDIPTAAQLMELMRTHSDRDLAKLLDVSEDSVHLAFISFVLVNRVCKATNVERIYVPDVTLCDGMAYEYGEENKLISIKHNFEQDIIACAKNISKRYMGSRKRSETLEQIAMNIFEAMKKIHGLDKRAGLLLRLAALLHDCGKYISLANLGECSYNIIMSTEIIGLSHTEREIVANVVKYNHLEFDYYESMNKGTNLAKEDYMIIAKLTAILKLANGLDRSHKQKFKDVRIVLKEQELVITVDTPVDITLERGLFKHRAEFFKEVYSITPVIKQKRS